MWGEKKLLLLGVKTKVTHLLLPKVFVLGHLDSRRAIHFA